MRKVSGRDTIMRRSVARNLKKKLKILITFVVCRTTTEFVSISLTNRFSYSYLSLFDFEPSDFDIKSKMQ